MTICSVLHYWLECDNCGVSSAEWGLPCSADENVIIRKVNSLGWRVDDNEHVLCKTCDDHAEPAP